MEVPSALFILMNSERLVIYIKNVLLYHSVTVLKILSVLLYV
jgi:hypothetical protein